MVRDMNKIWVNDNNQSGLSRFDDWTYKYTILLLPDIRKHNIRLDYALASDWRLHGQVTGREVHAWLGSLTVSPSTI